jgi:hypothetical protein
MPASMAMPSAGRPIAESATVIETSDPIGISRSPCSRLAWSGESSPATHSIAASRRLGYAADRKRVVERQRVPNFPGQQPWISSKQRHGKQEHAHDHAQRCVECQNELRQRDDHRPAPGRVGDVAGHGQRSDQRGPIHNLDHPGGNDVPTKTT